MPSKIAPEIQSRAVIERKNETCSYFAIWAALERIGEAGTHGAETIITACPWCEINFNDAIKETRDRF